MKRCHKNHTIWTSLTLSVQMVLAAGLELTTLDRHGNLESKVCGKDN